MLSQMRARRRFRWRLGTLAALVRISVTGAASCPLGAKPRTWLVDGVARGDVAYVVQLCPSGLGSGQSASVARSSRDGLEELSTRAPPGRYLWRAIVTPRGLQAYELQAVVPLPESISLHHR